jgi:hypothetical protein
MITKNELAKFEMIQNEKRIKTLRLQTAVDYVKKDKTPHLQKGHDELPLDKPSCQVFPFNLRALK